MTTAKVLPFVAVPLAPPLMACVKCGATTEAPCKCGANYKHKPAGQRAAEAVASHPEMSDHAIAEVIGVGTMTVSRARKKLTVPNGTVEKRTGRDGKKRRARKSKAPPVHAERKSRTPALDRAREIVRPLVLADQSANPKTLAKQHGISHPTFEAAFAVERAVRAVRDEYKIDINVLPGRDREKLDTAIRQERHRLEAEFDDRVKAEVRTEFRSIMLKEFQEHHDDVNSDEQRWQWSLINFTGHAISLNAFWDREFGNAWRDYPATTEIITLAEQAATFWSDLVNDLKKRRSQ